MWFTWWSLVWALVGAFGTAALNQHIGRDPRIGGLIGLLVGFVFGPFYLLSLWVWIYYTRGGGGVIKKYRRWYEWWRP